MENVNTTDTYRSWHYYDYSDYIIFDTHAELRWSVRIMFLIVYTLAFVLGVLGNGVVIWVTGFKMKKTVHTVWFLNLAVADFLFIGFLPLNAAYLALDFHWPFGEFMCKLSSTLISLNMFASVYILMMISVDRCVSVLWPVWAQNHRSVQKASYVSLSVWILALILSSRIFIFNCTGSSYLHDDSITSRKHFALYNYYTTPSVNQLQAMTITFLLAIFRSCLNPLLYVLVGQDCKNRVCKSILSAMETAFQEDVSDSHTESVDTRQSTEMSALNTDV